MAMIAVNVLSTEDERYPELISSASSTVVPCATSHS